MPDPQYDPPGKQEPPPVVTLSAEFECPDTNSRHPQNTAIKVCIETNGLNQMHQLSFGYRNGTPMGKTAPTVPQAFLVTASPHRAPDVMIPSDADNNAEFTLGVEIVNGEKRLKFGSVFIFADSTASTATCNCT